MVSVVIARRDSLLTALALVALALYIALRALPAARYEALGFAAYYAAAHVLAYSPQDMGHIYDDATFDAHIARAGFVGIHDVFNVQPPTMSLIALPLVGLPPMQAQLIWTLLNLVWLLAGLALLAHAFGLPALWGVWALPIALLYVPTRENVRAGQAYLLLFALLCLAFWALARPKAGWRSDGLAGAALGLMLTLKTGGAWLWPLLLLARRWRTLLVAAALTAGLALATLPWIGIDAWAAYVARLPELGAAPRRFVTAYQTTTSLFGHLLVYDARWNPTPVANMALLARTLTIGALLLSLGLSACWGRLNDPRREVRVLTLALFSVLVVTNAPFAESYHYTLALPALLTAIWWAGRAGARRWRLWGALALAALLLGLPLPYKSPRLEAGWLALLAYPRVYGAYLLWLVLTLMLGQAVGRRMTFKPFLRGVRDSVMSSVEQVWALGFALAGRLARPTAQRWWSPGGQRVLAVAPHPDDEAIGCGGTLLRHRASGDQVCVAFITDGRRSRALGLEPAEMAIRREQEALASAQVLGVERVEWLGLPEGQWTAAQLDPLMRGLLQAYAPDIIYAPSRVDFHPEHCRVAEVLALVLAGLPPGARPRVRVYQIQAPLTRILINLVADTASVAAQSGAALDVYVSQRGNMARALRQRRYAAAYHQLEPPAEEFWELTAEQYVALHSDLRGWSGQVFRGVRQYPIGDPLAYLRGRSERRRLSGSIYCRQGQEAPCGG